MSIKVEELVPSRTNDEGFNDFVPFKLSECLPWKKQYREDHLNFLEKIRIGPETFVANAESKPKNLLKGNEQLQNSLCKFPYKICHITASFVDCEAFHTKKKLCSNHNILRSTSKLKL